ncbi:SDR family NAD(P)-dependent oxidoreductase [Falsihalocynthiibacter arcticus]|uniref:Oxidoreductase n=1 Tax=Falsihalocynthiibacter arcticus TaxID=1579316 RepID=A0A126V523_9RHOB|nr:SDR family NAD(P)-dependent oxidoreductase [Falsihalocynthiibacter arcticus]AML52976.1 oxidoreductase [Falsihalocynthiibacter arcticus]
MTKTILITGATDGIGLLTAKMLAAKGHLILLHGRNADKLAAAAKEVGSKVEVYLADLTRLGDVTSMADEILARHANLDVLINNAGVLKAAETRTPEGLDVRFMVNTFAPFVLTNRLLAIIPKSGRVVNLSSAAQAPVDLAAMAGESRLGDMEVYAQSKLAITVWGREMARVLPDGPVIVAVNPGSLLASKMVKEGFGIAGNDLAIGADILCEAALDASFADASGKYFDNDAGQFANPNAAALNADHAASIMQEMTRIIASIA